MPPLAIAAGVLSFVLDQLRPHTREGELGAQAAFAPSKVAQSPSSLGAKVQTLTSHRMFYPALIGGVLILGGAIWWRMKK